MRRSRPVREHDPEWPWDARFTAASWKALALITLGAGYGMALIEGGLWAASFGIVALVLWFALMAQIIRERREN